MKKKLFVICLSLLMIAALVPSVVMAEGEPTTPGSPTEVLSTITDDEVVQEDTEVASEELIKTEAPKAKSDMVLKKSVDPPVQPPTSNGVPFTMTPENPENGEWVWETPTNPTDSTMPKLKILKDGVTVSGDSRNFVTIQIGDDVKRFTIDGVGEKNHNIFIEPVNKRTEPLVMTVNGTNVITWTGFYNIQKWDICGTGRLNVENNVEVKNLSISGGVIFEAPWVSLDSTNGTLSIDNATVNAELISGGSVNIENGSTVTGTKVTGTNGISITDSTVTLVDAEGFDSTETAMLNAGGLNWEDGAARPTEGAGIKINNSTVNVTSSQFLCGIGATGDITFSGASRVKVNMTLMDGTPGGIYSDGGKVQFALTEGDA